MSDKVKILVVGLGSMGLQDVFFLLRIEFDSDEARDSYMQMEREISPRVKVLGDELDTVLLARRQIDQPILRVIGWTASLCGLTTLAALAIGALIGGAVGNIIDRVYYGAVADFFDIHLYGYHWPAFNIADSAITIGVVLILYDAFFARTGKSKDGEAEEGEEGGKA